MKLPFEGFILSLSNGRELHIPHPEYGQLEQFAVAVIVLLPTRQIEVVDTSLIVSIRTIYASDPGAWTGPTNAT
ncbi:MAG TPA: hypothetical protein VG326_16425 [Tepidisphaeraceae bacterium]|nr:hypothetical protein [Tepidisphaeraceae bacterium]